uniref:Protein FAM47A n=1 Tax=Prolemur simus TaxID=1328070 RepID=A0A8C8Z0J6_PROSS
MDRAQLLRPWTLEPMPLGMNYKPWYNDKLPSQCFAKHKNRLLKFPTSLNSRQWVFVKEGLDDFRKGCPPCEGLITRGPKEAFLPMISHRVPQPAPRTSQRKLSKDAGLLYTFSRVRQARKAFVDDIEARLTQHPLALYPNLEEDLPADLLLKVLEVLDPERKLEDTWAYCEGKEKRTREPMKLCKHHCRKAFLGPPRTPVSHPDDLPQEETPATTVVPPDFLRYRRNLPRIRSFCEWVGTFGITGIDEEFMVNLFDFDSEFTPTYVPLRMKKIKDLTSVLKHSDKLSEMEEIQFSIEELDVERKLQKPPNPYKPDWVKMRYGAWYLKPKLCKKLINDEPLIDPKILLEAEARARKPDIIDELYGTIAFKDFIVSKGYEMPDILKKLFRRKGWNYDSVKTPMERAMKTYAIIDDPSLDE